MGEVVPIGAQTTPRDIFETLMPDAERMSAVVVVVMMDDGSWHVRHSTARQSFIDSAAINLIKYVTA